MLGFQSIQDLRPVHLLDKTPIDQLVPVTRSDATTENGTSILIEQRRHLLGRPYAENRVRHGNTLRFLHKRTVFSKKKLLALENGPECFFSSRRTAPLKRTVLAIHIRHDSIGPTTCRDIQVLSLQPREHSTCRQFSDSLEQPSIRGRRLQVFDFDASRVLYKRSVAGEWQVRFHSSRQDDKQATLHTQSDLHSTWREGGFAINRNHPLLADLVKGLVGKLLKFGSQQQVPLLRGCRQDHPV